MSKVKSGITPSDVAVLNALISAKGLLTVDEIAGMLPKSNGEARKPASVKTSISTLKTMFTKAGKKFPAPLPKGMGTGQRGRTSQAISVDDFLNSLADVAG